MTTKKITKKTTKKPGIRTVAKTTFDRKTVEYYLPSILEMITGNFPQGVKLLFAYSDGEGGLVFVYTSEEEAEAI